VAVRIVSDVISGVRLWPLAGLDDIKKRATIATKQYGA
jgi:hypothetical protein